MHFAIDALRRFANTTAKSLFSHHQEDAQFGIAFSRI
jgi:hypothetical protein